MISQRDYDMADYPWWLFTRVAGHVEHGDHETAHVDLDQVLNRMEVEHGPELAPRKMRCAAHLKPLPTRRIPRWRPGRTSLGRLHANP